MTEYLPQNPRTLTHDQLLAGLAAAERAAALAQSWSLRALATLAREPAPEPERQWVRSEVAVALRWSERFTAARFALAKRVITGLPSALAALAEGRITLGHLQAIADRSNGLDEQSARDLEDDVLFYAETHTIADTRRKVKRVLLKLDPDVAAERTRQGVRERDVWLQPDDVPGLTRVGSLLPADGAAELMAALEQMASRPGDVEDRRTKAQRRADALVELGRNVLSGGCAHCGLPARPVAAAVTVTVALSTLLGLDEQAGELNGEPIPAPMARALAADRNGTWRRLVTDALGEVVDYGRTTYRPPTALREFVRLRDRRCRFPGCTRAATACDLDHVVAWNDNGRTDARNLACLCERHHYLKHSDMGWQLTLWPDGTCVWTSPAGQTILVGPATYPVDSTSGPRNAAATDGFVVSTGNGRAAAIGGVEGPPAGSLTGSTVDIVAAPF